MPALWLHAHLQSSSRAHLCPALSFPAHLLPGVTGEQGMPVPGWLRHRGQRTGGCGCPASTGRALCPPSALLHTL